MPAPSTLERPPRAARVTRPERWSETLRGWRMHALLRAIALFGSRPLPLKPCATVVFAPHQDDESLGCGGLIARKRQLGARVKVVFLTDGRRSHDAHSTLRPDVATLSVLRQEEATAALGILGVAPADITFLDFADGGLNTLDATDRVRCLQAIAALLRKFRPEEIFVPHRADIHPDHLATFTLVRAAMRQADSKAPVLEYAIWLLWQCHLPGYNLPLAVIRPAWRLPIREVAEQKRAAIQAHRSQIDPAILPPAFLSRFALPFELFFQSAEPTT